jgi:hypothetical protein
MSSRHDVTLTKRLGADKTVDLVLKTFDEFGFAMVGFIF